VSLPLTAIISDLHGNVPALEAMLDDAHKQGVQRFVCLGDMVGYGANPRYALDLVMHLCGEQARWPEGVAESELQPGLCLKGNHEEALLSSASDFNPKARMAIEWTRGELDSDRERCDVYWDFIFGLSASASDERAMYAHGSPRDPVREYMLPRDIKDHAKMRENFAAMTRSVCFVGHSHVPGIYYEDERYFLPRGTSGPYLLGDTPDCRVIVNVGSVGQPRDGDCCLSYLLFDGEMITFRRIEYEIERAAAAIRAVDDLPEFLAERLFSGR
jgi:predicted phosphodiesterase